MRDKVKQDCNEIENKGTKRMRPCLIVRQGHNTKLDADRALECGGAFRGDSP